MTCFSAVAVTGPNKHRAPDAIPGSNLALLLLLSKDFYFPSFCRNEQRSPSSVGGSLLRQVYVLGAGREGERGTMSKRSSGFIEM